jgi:multidrug efflux pump subunit AcrA (membrane-fusion protein)
MPAFSLSRQAFASSLLMFTALSVATLSGCKGQNASVDAASEPVSAAVSVVQRGKISHVLSLAGQFQPYQLIDVDAKVSGYVHHIYVDIGDRVRAAKRSQSSKFPN